MHPEPASARTTLEARAPFLSWKALYTIVLCALAVEIAACFAITLIYR
jgi:hypothetical protein